MKITEHANHRKFHYNETLTINFTKFRIYPEEGKVVLSSFGDAVSATIISEKVLDFFMDEKVELIEQDPKITAWLDELGMIDLKN